jgi:membrane protein DedA with SNARE-associated domain
MEQLVPRLLEALARYGYVIIFAIMVVEEAGVPSPIPGDGLLLFTGYLAARGTLSFPGALLAVIAGALVGATVLYWIARHGGRSIVRRYGRLLRIDDRHLEKLKGLFDRFGYVGPGVSRLVPGLRIYTSALSGLAVVPYPLFLLNVLWAVTVWALVFLLLGTYFGAHWQEYTRYSERAGLVVVGAVVVGICAWIWLRRRRARRSS